MPFLLHSAFYLILILLLYYKEKLLNPVFVCDFSPPLWVCWRFLPNCMPDVTEGCTLTMLYDNMLKLNLTFASAGYHCLDISVRNEISKLQTSFSLYVRRNSKYPPTTPAEIPADMLLSVTLKQRTLGRRERKDIN